jgi:hypothetical protein
MRKLAMLVLSTGMVLPAFADEKPPTTQMFTVAQLEEALAAAHGLPDKKLAEHIADVKLTERLSDANFARIQAGLPGPKSKLALLALADESAFLDLPAAEIPSTPAPDHATQLALINRAMDYVLKEIPKLPDFFATRTTTRFGGTPLIISGSLHEALFPGLEGNQRLTGLGTTSVSVRYSNGLEVFADPKKAAKTECRIHNGAGGSSGEFGEVLTRVAYEATHGKMVWSHWEQGVAGLLAVFHYQARLAYKFPNRCPHEIATSPDLVDFQGEIAVNPVDGSILRLTEMSRINDDLFGLGAQIEHNNIMVEYASVEIGGTTYLCPVKSVYFTFGAHFFDTRLELDRFDKSYGLSEDPVVESVNNMTFTDYHMFRATTHILTGAPSGPDANPPASAPATPPSQVPAPSPQY